MTMVEVTHELATTNVGNGEGDRTAFFEFTFDSPNQYEKSSTLVITSVYLLRSVRYANQAFTVSIGASISRSNQLQTKLSMKGSDKLIMLGVSYLLIDHSIRYQPSQGYPELQKVADRIIEIYGSGHNFKPSANLEKKPMLFVASYKREDMKKERSDTVIAFMD